LYFALPCSDARNSRVSSYYSLTCNVSSCTFHFVVSPHIRDTGTHWCIPVIRESVSLWSTVRRTRSDVLPRYRVVGVWFLLPRYHLFSLSCASVSNVLGFCPAIPHVHNRYISSPSIPPNNENTPYVMNCGWSVGRGFWVLSRGFWVVGYGLWVMDCGLWALGFGLWACGLRATGYGLWVMGCGLWVMDHGL
jgi:hypothetical protein